MAKQTNDYKPTGFRNECVAFSNADGTTTKDIVVADADDSVIIQLSVASLATSDATLRFYLHDGTTDFFLVDVVIPASSGVGAAAAVDVLAKPFIYNASLPLETGWKLRAAAVSAVSASGDVIVCAIVTDY